MDDIDYHFIDAEADIANTLDVCYKFRPHIGEIKKFRSGIAAFKDEAFRELHKAVDNIEVKVSQPSILRTTLR